MKENYSTSAKLAKSPTAMTYVQAQQKIIAALKLGGWLVNTELKQPKASFLGITVWFKSQSLYASRTNRFNEAHSLHVSTKDLATHPPEEIHFRIFDRAQKITSP